MNTCTVPSCGRSTRLAGWCERCRALQRMYGTPTPGCRAEGCQEPFYGQGYCSVHLSRWRSFGTPYYDPHVPAAPLIRYVEQTAGGFGAAFTAAGYLWDTPEREALDKAAERLKHDGYLTAVMADRIAVDVFRVHPALIWGDAWWIHYPADALTEDVAS